nr:SCAN domain-containing protein 3-like [Onthophagus taurus]
MLNELSTRYKNITRHDVELYLQLCEPCQQKQKGIKKGIVVKPILSSEFNSRCQVDLIDYQSHPDREYKFVMVYQDHLTKFVILRALKTKRAEEVAYNLLDIFTLIGAPAILQSDNGREFSNQIVSSLKTYWPTLKIVHGKPRHSQSQGSVERANQDIENMLTTWMQDSDSNRWSDGLRFVQLMKNKAFHSGIKRTPYEALFGSKVKVGISLPLDDTHNLESEEDLENMIKSSPSILILSESLIVDRVRTQNQPLEAQHQQSPVIESSEIRNEVSNAQSAFDEHDDEHMTIQSAETLDELVNVESLPSEVHGQPLYVLNFVSEREQSLDSPLLCCVCTEGTTGTLSCRTCNRPIHAICGAPEKDMAEGYGFKVVCPLCLKNALAVQNRISSKDNLTEQGPKMLKLLKKKIPPVPLGTTVRIPVPEVDRGRGDARNILAVVLQKTDDELYKIGTKQGVVKNRYSRQQFTVCRQELLKKEDVPQETTLRTVANLQ